jgi:hypothetical protein
VKFLFELADFLRGFFEISRVVFQRLPIVRLCALERVFRSIEPSRNPLQ